MNDNTFSFPSYLSAHLGHTGEAYFWRESISSVVDGHLSNAVWAAGASWIHASERATGQRQNGIVLLLYMIFIFFSTVTHHEVGK